jgi:pimeloyl-ACP methyl ester carboxylesterase
VVFGTEETFSREPIILRFQDNPAFVETYGFHGSQGLTLLEGQLLRPARSESKTLFVFMHPSTTMNLLPMPLALAEAGLNVLCAASRYPKNDSALIMEKVALDMGAWVRWAYEQAGYERVVLVGWSGGGSLSLFYQAQAEHPTIRDTPAGDPVDLVAAKLLPVDGVIFIAAHLSRAETLTEWMDPSVVDELDPGKRDRHLDIYAADAEITPPFDPSFVVEFRAAQIARNRRITEWCLDLLGRLKKGGTPEVERAFVVHRTMCDPRWIDPTLDPNDRKPGVCYLGDPRTANVGPAGLARYSSLRSWLSQWSVDLSRAKGPENAARIKKVPVLVIENSADDAVPATHPEIIRQSLGASDKEFVTIKNATHYYLGQPELLQQCVDAVLAWSRSRNLLPDAG